MSHRTYIFVPVDLFIPDFFCLVGNHLKLLAVEFPALSPGCQSGEARAYIRQGQARFPRPGASSVRVLEVG